MQNTHMVQYFIEIVFNIIASGYSSFKKCENIKIKWFTVNAKGFTELQISG